MNELQIFKNDEFGEIRILMRDGEPWFVASDICKVLELSNITETLKRVDEDELSITEVIDSLGRRQQVYIVNEAGLYNLILLSRTLLVAVVNFSEKKRLINGWKNRRRKL